MECIARQPLPTEWGAFELHVFRNVLDDRRHFAVTMGELDPEPTLVRVHSENVLGDIFRSTDITGRDSIAKAMRRIAEAGRGALVYIEQPNSGLALEGAARRKPGGFEPHP